MNNLAVVELKAGNVEASLTAARQALSYVEGEILAEINQNATQRSEHVWSAAFLERVQVLLVTYFNYGMCQQKLDQPT